MALTFVTGGSGFIGSALIRRLIHDGHSVRALVRSDDGSASIAALGAEPVRGDLTDVSAWADLIVGSDVVFHLAAETDIDADPLQHELITVRGTRDLVAAAQAAQVPRFVLCGSEAALLAGDPLIEVDETAPLRPDSPAAYSAAKAEAENIVLRANAPAFATVSIRPRFVWGPGSGLIEGLVAAVRAGGFAWIGGGRHRTDVTFVDNAVEGLLLGWLRGLPGQAYFITDQERVVLRDFLQAQFDLYGLTGEIPDIDAETAARQIPVPALWFLGQPCLLRTEKASLELGYTPVISQSTGLAMVRDALVTAAR